MTRERDNHVILPPAPPYRFWMTEPLRPLQAKLDAGATLTSEEFVEYHRLRGRQDLYFFAKYCLGFDWLEWDLHGPLAWAWQRENGDQEDGITYGRMRMALIPRGHLKTTLCTQAFALWLLVRNPEERILIYSSNMTQAKKIFAFIKATLGGLGTHGQFFKACFGDIIPAKQEREKWTDSMLNVKRVGAYTDASLQASGVGSTITGGHFTWQLVDDVVGEQLSREQMQKVIAAFDNLTPMYSSLKDGQRRVVGTYWAFYDPYTYVHKFWPHALVARRTWLEKDGAPTGDYDAKHLIFSRCDVEEALTLKRRNPFFFSCQYELNPRDEGKIGFRRDWFRYFRRHGDTLEELDREMRVVRKVKLAALNIFVLIDPNTGRVPGQQLDSNQRRDHDYVGIVVLGVDPDNVWYVLRAVRKRYNPDELITHTFALADFWKPLFVAMERVAAQNLFFHIFRMAMKRLRKWFNLIDWKGGQQSKEERIKGLIPLYANGLVLHRLCDREDEQQAIHALEDELVDFPNAEYDDLSDALSAAIPLVYARGREPSDSELKPWTPNDELDQLDESSARAWRLTEQKDEATLFSLGNFFAGDR
jgi:phage terminase large subunit-like protein